jgi:hypothetical protein
VAQTLPGRMMIRPYGYGNVGAKIFRPCLHGLVARFVAMA